MGVAMWLAVLQGKQAGRTQTEEGLHAVALPRVPLLFAARLPAAPRECTCRQLPNKKTPAADPESAHSRPRAVADLLLLCGTMEAGRFIIGMEAGKFIVASGRELGVIR